jgi:chorismate mutase
MRASVRAGWQGAILSVLVAGGLCGCRTAPPPEAATDPALDSLLSLVRQRLDLMGDVARWKWTHKAAVNDPAREAAFLNQMADAGAGHGLDRAATTRFFAAQIEAAKVLQQADFDRWAAEGRGPFPDAPDLKQTLRPAIDRVSRELLAALAAALAAAPHAPPPEAVRRAADRHLGGLPDAARSAAVAPLLGPPG